MPNIRLPNIRLIALSVFRQDDRILVASGFDEVKDQRFFRPLGGAIEFGELAVEALHREIREELGVEIENPVQLGVLETRFEYCGEPGHEIVFVFDATFVDRELYEKQSLPIFEDGWHGPATWLDLNEPRTASLFPEGLEDLLRRSR